MIHIKILGVSIAALAASAVIGAAYGKTVRLSPLGGIGASATADEGDTVKVKGRGVGTTRTEALKDAYRDAVERAVGLYVDAESAVNNDELVEDKILTHSNAYIERYDEIDIKKIDGGLIQIRIVATVKKRELTTSLSKVLPKHSGRYEGSFKDIHAQIVSEEKRDADGCKLLQNTLMGLDPCTLLAVPSVDMTHKQVIKEGKLGYNKNIPDGQVILRLLLRLKFNEEKYFKEFVPVVKPVLDQIASSSKNVKLSLLEDPKLARFSVFDDYLCMEADSRVPPDRAYHPSLNRGLQLLDQRPCMSSMRVLYGGGYLMGMGEWSGNLCDSLAREAGCKAVHFESSGYSEGCGWPRRVHSWRKPHNNRSEGSVGIDDMLRTIDSDRRSIKRYRLILVCGVNKSHTVWDAVFYDVDKRCAAVFMGWCYEYGDSSGETYGGDPDAASKQGYWVKYNVSYCDKSGDCVLMKNWRIPRICLMNADWGGLEHSYHYNEMVLYISPFLGCYSEEFVQWHDALIKTDMLQEIESVKIGMDN